MKLTLATIGSRYASVAALNANFAAIVAAIENTVSRDGTSPNSMSGNLDMNSNRILNVPAPTSDNEPITRAYLSTLENNAYTSAVGAAASAAAASTSQTSAASSATSASSSASSASTSASNASTSASNAASSASAASTSASSASSSASSASSSASSASSSASTASSAATSASAAQVAAEAALASTLTAYDNFDDRYLGSKTSDPSVDNDGNALVAGSLYFNSSSGAMKVYTGSAWVAAYISGSGYLAAANNLSDVSSASTSRTNLGATATGSSLFTAASASAARTTLGSTATGDSLFTAASASAARSTLGLGTAATMTGPSGSIVGDTDSQTLTNKTLTNPSVNNYTEGVVTIGTVNGSGATLSLTNGTVQTATLTASTASTFTMPTATAGKSFVLLLKQAASTGNGTATFTSVKWGTAGAPTITATAGKMDILSFFSDGTNWYGSITQGYTP